MNHLDHEEQEILEAYEAGALRSVATAADRSRLEASARATTTKDQRISIRLTSQDLDALPMFPGDLLRLHLHGAGSGQHRVVVLPP